ncbi:MAG: DUF4258 domain-containing protein [Nitrosotalea sp.]
MTRHGLMRLLERDITVEQIEGIINNPIETVFDKESGNYLSYGMATHQRFLTLTYLMVAHSKFNTEVSIITAMWQTKGGLQNNGFSTVR